MRSHLWDGGEQLVQRGVAVGAALQIDAGVFREGGGELAEEDLVVVVGVQERSHAAGKLVEARQPHPLPAADLSILLLHLNLIQLQDARMGQTVRHNTQWLCIKYLCHLKIFFFLFLLIFFNEEMCKLQYYTRRKPF